MRVRAERAFRHTTLQQVLEGRRQIIGPGLKQLIADAREARKALLAGSAPTPGQQAALERAIRLQRPAPCCVRDGLTPLADDGGPFADLWPAFQPLLRRLQRGVARIDRVDALARRGQEREPVGTGFLVAPDLLLTARHVAEAISYDTLRLEPGQAVGKRPAARLSTPFTSRDREPMLSA